MDIEKELKKEKDICLSLLSRTRQDIAKYSKIAEGKRLVCTTSHNSYQYSINGKYVSKKDLTEARAIAQFDYCKRVEQLLTEKIGVIDGAIENYTEKNLDSLNNKMCPGRIALIDPYVIPKDIYIQNWINKKYEIYDRWEGVASEFYTDKGERVRSKSELIIANELSLNNIPYRYEYPLTLMDGNRQCIVHPDFIVLNRRTLKEYILEHLGMMDKSSYYNASINKIDLFERNGYLLGVNYLIIHETSLSALNVQVLRNYICEYMI